MYDGIFELDVLFPFMDVYGDTVLSLYQNIIVTYCLIIVSWEYVRFVGTIERIYTCK